MGKKTVIIGATPDTTRYAYRAASMLTEHGHEIVPVGMKKGQVFGKQILNGQPPVENVDTVTLYVSPQNQDNLLNYIIGLRPKRIIFNPGTENEELIRMAEENNIEPVIGCTLVMLASRTY
jgi:predicted CoA-binding protein